MGSVIDARANQYFFSAMLEIERFYSPQFQKKAIILFPDLQFFGILWFAQPVEMAVRSGLGYVIAAFYQPDGVIFFLFFCLLVCVKVIAEQKIVRLSVVIPRIVISFDRLS